MTFFFFFFFYRPGGQGYFYTVYKIDARTSIRVTIATREAAGGDVNIRGGSLLAQGDLLYLCVNQFVLLYDSAVSNFVPFGPSGSIGNNFGNAPLILCPRSMIRTKTSLSFLMAILLYLIAFVPYK